MSEKPTVALPGGMDVEGLLSVVREAAERAKALEGKPERFAVYAGDPVGFCREILGVGEFDAEGLQPGLTPGQVAFLEALARGDRRVAIRAGHGVGKSFVMACATVWWLYAKQGLVVTTASTWDQVERVLWREIAGLVSGARVSLPGEVLQTELRVRLNWYAVGLSTNNPTSFQGRHHEHLLVIVDEAPGVGEDIHRAISSLATGEKNCVAMVGNPYEASGAFYEAFRKPGWTRLHLSCLDHPNVVLGREIIPGAVTRVWVDEQREKYGEDSPVYGSMVLGEFPTGASSTVCPMAWVDRAMDRERYRKALEGVEAGEPVVVALDVARYGDNRCVLAVRQGDVIREIRDWGQASTMETAGLVIQAVREWDAAVVVVDEVGLGAGVLDRLLEQGVEAVGFNSGRPAAVRSMYQNRRAELWFAVRERLERQRLWLPDLEPLRMDLTAPTYKVSSTGKIAVERKEDLRARGIASPDFADAVCMAFAMDVEEGYGVEEVAPDRVRLDRDATLILNADEGVYHGGPMGWLGSGF